jgi:hypothetical protein
VGVNLGVGDVQGALLVLNTLLRDVFDALITRLIKRFERQPPLYRAIIRLAVDAAMAHHFRAR